MIFKWESEEDRLLKFMRIPPKKKLEWLRQMNELLCRVSTKRQRDNFQRLREGR